MPRDDAGRSSRAERARDPVRDAYSEWFWRTWPNHALPDPEAKRRAKAVLNATVGVAGAMIGLAIVGTLISRTPGGRGFGDIISDFVDKGIVPVSTNDTSPASDDASDTGSVTSPSLTELRQ